MKILFATILTVLTLSSVQGKTQVKAFTLALNWKAEPEFGGFYEAQLKNLYQKQGLQIKILEGGSGTPTIQMLANGKVDFAIVSADELILAHDRNPKNKIKALFAVYQTSPYIIMTHAERNFKSLKEVFATEGILSLQSGLPYYSFLVQKFGKPKARVVPYSGGVGSFLNNKQLSQQGFLTIEPVAADRAGQKTKNFVIADEGFNPYLVVVAVTEKFWKSQPETVKALHRAVLEGWQLYLKDPKTTNLHMSQLNKSLDLATFERASEIQKPLIQSDPLGQMTEERWTTLIEQMRNLKLIHKPIQAKDLFLTL